MSTQSSIQDVALPGGVQRPVPRLPSVTAPQSLRRLLESRALTEPKWSEATLVLSRGQRTLFLRHGSTDFMAALPDEDFQAILDALPTSDARTNTALGKLEGLGNRVVVHRLRDETTVTIYLKREHS